MNEKRKNAFIKIWKKRKKEFSNTDGRNNNQQKYVKLEMRGKA